MSTETVARRAPLPPAARAPGFSRALAYEWAAMRTMRSNWLLIGAAVVLQVLLTVLGHDSRDTGDITFEKVAGVMWLFVPIIAAIGVNSFGAEYRYRTITTTVLTVRPRAHVLLAKACTVGVVALIAQAMLLAVSWLVLALSGAVPTVPTTLVIGVGALVYAVLTALIGLALAGLVRAAVLPIALLVVWPQIEMFLINRLELPEWVLVALEPFYSARRLITTDPQWHLGLPMLVLAAILLGAAAVLLTRRDT